MTVRKKRWLIGLAAAAALAITGLVIAASILGKRFEPYIHAQAIQYLSKRFDSDVQLEALHIRMPKMSTMRVLLLRGRGAVAEVDGEGLSLRYHGRRDLPPILQIRSLSFSVDLGTLFNTPKMVPLVTMDGVEIHIPPKDQRPAISGGGPPSKPGSQPQSPSQPSVIIQQIQIRNASIEILPRNSHKLPLREQIRSLRLDSAGAGVAMRYDASLTNARPPGNIHTTGTFGPWSADEPGDTPLTGKYVFEHADLGVFNGIAGILHSSGELAGKLSALNVHGRADVPDFRLKRVNQPVRLSTTFEALVDGTNGNTILKPVNATLGSTRFTTSGGVVQHEANLPRSVDLVANIPNGDLRDVLRLAMAGPPFMEGRLTLNTKIGIPPLTGPVREKLQLDGRFQVTGGKFLRSTIQAELDKLSRRAQGEPGNQGIDEVASNMHGVFQLANETLHFSELSFGVPGAQIDLAGDYNTASDALDLLGTVKFQAKVSELAAVSGWKRWALKAVDPLFERHGAGTFLRIKVQGTSRAPKFGLVFRKP
jgi:hypothetical protein